MKVTASAVSLNVEDVTTSSRFLQRRFGFAEVMAAGGLASLARHDIGMNVVCSRRGLPVRPGDQRAARPGPGLAPSRHVGPGIGLRGAALPRRCDHQPSAAQ